MFLIAWTVHTALAAPVGFHHPLDVADASQRFAEAQAVAGEAFASRQERAASLAAALRAYEEALDLLGDRAPEEARARFLALDKAFRRDQAIVSAFAQDQLDTFDAAFSGALSRAIGARTLDTCRVAPERTLRVGPRGPSPKPEACEGADLNAELAAHMDADPQLAADLSQLLDAAWPAFEVDVQPIAPVAGDPWLDLHAVFATHTGPALTAIATADEDARLDFQVAIEQGASLEARQAMLDKARTITQRTASQRAAMAAPVLEAVEAMVAKDVKKGGPAIGWCAQPALFGGCTGAPAAAPVAARLIEHPKVAKALERASAWRP